MSNVLIDVPDSVADHNKGRCSMYIAHQNISILVINSYILLQRVVSLLTDEHILNKNNKCK